MAFSTRVGGERKAEDNYTHGYSKAVTQSHNLRTAEKYAHHVIPLLATATSVLDVGCGTGSITKGIQGISYELCMC